MRFKSTVIRKFGACLFLIRATIGMGIVLYGPSTALSAVTPFPVWSVILIVGVVCTFYTSIGGMKAVIWTDVFQTLVMMAGMLAIFIQGCIQVGGIEEVWRRAYDADRIEFFRFDADPRVRHTFWALTVGIYCVWLPPYTVDQQMVQRFSSTKSLKDAKLALLMNVPGMFILITLCSLTGLAMFANYSDCDPIKQKSVSNANQLLPFFVMDTLGHLPGVPGLFVSSLFSGALSSVSSMLNSLAAVTWEDFLKNRFNKTSDEQAAKITKGLAVMFGVLGVAMAFVVERLGGTVLQISLTLNGAAGAPLVGIFILGVFFVSANWVGALVGGVFGFAFSMWLSIGAYVTRPLDYRLPTSDLGCNSSMLNTSTTTVGTPLLTTKQQDSIDALEGLEKLYGLSYIWFTVIGLLTVLVVGLFVSCITGSRIGPQEVEEHLVLRCGRKSCCIRSSTDEQKNIDSSMDNNKSIELIKSTKLEKYKL
ncbi:hypothetical protein ScPMuIL_015277 [Solemya velum]